LAPQLYIDQSAGVALFLALVWMLKLLPLIDDMILFG
jgi:hypothetical protein